MQDTKFIKVPHQGSQGTTYPSWRRDTWSIIEVKIGHWSLSPYEGHVPVCLAICYPGLLQPSLPRISIWNHLNINTSVGAGTRLLQLVFGRVYLYFYVHGDETIMIIIYIYIIIMMIRFRSTLRSSIPPILPLSKTSKVLAQGTDPQ